MTTRRFSLDANVLVYAADRDSALHRRAVDVLLRATSRDCVLTLQALGEFFHAATRKGIISRPDAAAQVRDLLAIFPTVAADVEALRTALDGAERGQHSFWDGLLIATAVQAGCRFLLSEDMQDGARVGRVAVLNPFLGDALPAPVEALLG